MTGLTASLRLIMDGLGATLARYAGRQRSLAPLVLVLWPRLKHIVLRFEAVAARLRDQPQSSAAPAAPPRTTAERIIPPDTPPRPAPAPAPQPHHLPRRFAWGILLFPGHELPGYGAQLQHWLADPALPQMLAADPVLRRMLRSVCHMLAIRPDPAVLPPCRASRAARSGPAQSRPVRSRPVRPRKPRMPRERPAPLPTWEDLARTKDANRQAFQRWRRSGRTD